MIPHALHTGQYHVTIVALKLGPITVRPRQMPLQLIPPLKVFPTNMAFETVGI